MANPFDDDGARFVVLVNAERQYSLWPAGTPVPAGWDVAFAENSRAACDAYVEENWTDMRPASLAAAMAESAGD